MRNEYARDSVGVTVEKTREDTSRWFRDTLCGDRERCYGNERSKTEKNVIQR